MVMKNVILTGALLSSTAIYANSNFKINSIEFIGLERISQKAALAELPLKKGDYFNVSESSKIIKALYDTGNYSSIDLSSKNNNLIISVKENPIIANIEISGNKAIKSEMIKDNLKKSGVVVGSPLDQSKIDQIDAGLEDFYYSVGNFDATVKAVVTNLPRNRVNLNFVFIEGLSSRIKEINFIGNTVFTTQEIKDNLKLQSDVPWWNFVSDEKYKQQSLSDDIKTIDKMYKRKGYLKFKITQNKVSISPDKKGVYITLKFDEGKKYTVTDVTYSGDLKALGGVSKLKSELPFKLNKIYNGDLVDIYKRQLKRKLNNQGFSNSRVQVYPIFNDVNNSVVLNFNIQQGQRSYVRQVIFQGNSETKDTVIRRELPQMEGTWYNENKVQLGKRKLNQLGYFKQVDTKTQKVPNSPDQVDVVYDVQENNTGAFNFGIGYGTETKGMFKAGVNERNFLGTGYKVGLNGQTDAYNKSLSLDVMNPYFTLDGVSLGGNIHFTKFTNPNNDDGNSDYNYTNFGLSTTLGIPVSENNRLNFTLGYEHYDISNIPNFWQYRDTILQNESGPLNQEIVDAFSTNDYSVGVGFTHNTLNNPQQPTNGNKQAINFTVSLPNSSYKYYTMYLSSDNYFPLNEKQNWVFYLNFNGGYGTGYGGSTLPFYRWYSLGGSSLPGFGYNQVGPRGIQYDPKTGGYTNLTDSFTGGNALYAGKISLITPTPILSEKYQRDVRTQVFVAAGNVWNTQYKAPTNNVVNNSDYYDYSDPWAVRVSTGVQLTWFSPIAPLSFTFAKALKSYPGDDESFFSFDISTGF
ncbi:outer membrane protein assembly factor BamA [Paraphotobacterium marinum]|uniref:Outer membrane protein assembly factor BamA n=1 Tax=Paraphotobacterium marinum TaxID=1755811 RepID=A0A220VBP5_9GAMM|nr:outer membrane protein assembly factor BamA [Paraphotobacterium marinum]ASK77817.1 outer membrane protein assembly factor BamA [Paraphotobacterium marinum]